MNKLKKALAVIALAIASIGVGLSPTPASATAPTSITQCSQAWSNTNQWNTPGRSFACIDLVTQFGPVFQAWNGNAQFSPAFSFGVTLTNTPSFYAPCGSAIYQTNQWYATAIATTEFVLPNFPTCNGTFVTVGGTGGALQTTTSNHDIMRIFANGNGVNGTNIELVFIVN